MKSPQEWVDDYSKGLPDSGFVNATEMIRKWIFTIQQDAFESGRMAGLHQAIEEIRKHPETPAYSIRQLVWLCERPPATKSYVEVQK